jgi:predicted phosphodiesterase
MGYHREMRFVLGCVVCCACGNGPLDYPPPPLRDLGIHEAPTYVARNLMASNAMLIAHPRLGQPAIRRAGESFDVSWIAPGMTSVAPQLALDTGEAIASEQAVCDGDGICHATATLPATAPGLHGLCITLSTASACSPSAIAIVTEYASPATVVHLSDAHIGEEGMAELFGKVVDRINALDPPADFAIFTGDGVDDGLAPHRGSFVTSIGRLRIPVFIVTGNHDYENVGIDGHLIDVGPELDYAVPYGELRLVGLSSGQDLDDGNHAGTISESSGPDVTQLDWLHSLLADGPPASNIVFFHHPIYNALFATIGPQSRDRLKDLVTRDDVLAVLTGHTHVRSAFDADGNSRGLSLDGEDVPAARWPLHFSAARSTNGRGGFAVFHFSSTHVDYRWVSLE